MRVYKSFDGLYIEMDLSKELYGIHKLSTLI